MVRKLWRFSVRSEFNCIHWFYVSLKTFRRNVFKIFGNGTQGGRSCSLRPQLPLFSYPFPVRQKQGARISLSAGQRLKKHVPLGTSPAALSWNDLMRKVRKIIFVLPHAFSRSLLICIKALCQHPSSGAKAAKTASTQLVSLFLCRLLCAVSLQHRTSRFHRIMTSVFRMLPNIPEIPSPPIRQT